MVNVNKHKRLKAKFGMLPIENKEFMHKFNEIIINETNESPKTMIDTLNNLNNELNHYYDELTSSNIGSCFKIGTCQRILEIYEWVFVIKNTIHYNYHMLKIDGEIIKSILRKCDRVLNEYMNIKELQNKNIDRKGYGGLFSLMLLNSDANDYPKEQFESILRLNEPIHIGGDGSI